IDSSRRDAGVQSYRTPGGRGHNSDFGEPLIACIGAIKEPGPAGAVQQQRSANRVGFECVRDGKSRLPSDVKLWFYKWQLPGPSPVLVGSCGTPGVRDNETSNEFFR